MSDVVATRREAALIAPPSPEPARNIQERQNEALEKAEPAAKHDAAVAGPATELPSFKVGSMPWEDPLKEARWSVQSLDTHIKSQLSGAPTGSGPTLADAGNRVKAALEHVWSDPHLSSTLKAQGETKESIKDDLSAGRFEKVVTTFERTGTTLDAAHRQGVGLPPVVLIKPANDVSKAEPANAIATEPTAAKLEPSATSRAAMTQQDPIVELINRLQGASVRLTESDAGLARGIDKLAERASMDQSTTSQPMFRTHVAYSLQDTEKALGAGSIPMSSELRSEMTRLAGTNPGLENKQMENLVRSTQNLDDRGLVRDLRRAADSIATLGVNQNSAGVQQHVELLENRVRLAAKITPNKPSEVSSQKPGSLVPEPIGESVTSKEAPAATRAGADPSLARTPSTSVGGSIEAEGRTKLQPENISSTRSTASPGDGGQARESKPEDQRPTVPAHETSKPKTAMAQIMDNLRSPTSATPPPWAPSTFAMGERITKFEQLMGQGKTEQLIQASEKSGVAMMKSIETFSRGPGAEVLGKIDAAAGNEPGGVKAVMREMQPGGRYAELRSQFDNALQSDRAFAASYNQVEKNAAQHGKDRLALGADFQAKGLDVKQLDTRFQKADEAIGEATERIPGRTPGKSVMEELGQKVAEIFTKAIERVRSMFGREAAPEPRASATPGMSP